MRKQYNKSQNSKITNYFTQLVVEKYIIPAIAILFVVFFVLLLAITYFFDSLRSLDITAFISLIFINVLVSIATVSIYYTIKTCLFGYRQISQGHYTTLQLTCVETYRKGLHRYCKLSDGHTYKLYRDGNSFKQNDNCDLIVISNNYGAKLWEIVVPTIK